jgi:hypothetical protein
MNYPDGTQVHVGDSVLLNHGNNPGVVFDVIDTPHRISEWGVEVPGLMIESPVYGLVFWHAESLIEDEIAFVSRQLA